MTVGLVWAQGTGGVIGRDGGLPWHLPEDLRHFKALTTGATVVMGRRTWDSLPSAYRPLPGRSNVVLTRQAEWQAGDDRVRILGSVADALALPERPLWFIGGGEVYAQALPHAAVAVVTEVDVRVDGDTYAPALPAAEWRQETADPPEGWATSSSGLRYRITRWVRAGG